MSHTDFQNFHVNQTARVADVSNALDDLGKGDQSRVWQRARILSLQGKLSFLQSFEQALDEERL